MKISDLVKYATFLMLWTAATVIAEDEPEWLKVDENDIQSRPARSVGHEFNLGATYVGDSKLEQGDSSLGDTSSVNSYFDYTASVPLTDSIQGRLGVAYERFGFSSVGPDPLPGALQQTSLTLGFDTELSDKWIMRFELAPGIYSDLEDISITDVNVPIILGFSYLVDSKLQWVFGISADFRREIPVLPGAGVRWQFADQWVLNFILPKPRLEYQIDPSVLLYVGGEVKGGTYAVGNDVGSSVGQPNLDNEIVEYTEARVGGGVEYKLHPAAALHVEGGALVYRRFSFEDDDLQIEGDPAPYVSIGLKASF